MIATSLMVLGACFAPTISSQQDLLAAPARGAAVVTRQDFAFLVQTIDECYALGFRLGTGDESSNEQETQRSFDDLSLDFLRARWKDASKKLVWMEEGISASCGRPTTWGLKLDVRLDGRWLSDVRLDEVGTLGRVPASEAGPASGTGASTDFAYGVLRFRARTPYRMGAYAGKAINFAFKENPEGPFGGPLEPTTLRFDDEGWAEPVEFLGTLDLLATGKSRSPAIYDRFERETPFLGFGTLRFDFQSDPSPAEQRAEMIERASACGAIGDDALRAFTSRAELRWDRPSPNKSSEFLLDPRAHVAALVEELAALEAGQDPYASRVGDQWRTFAHGRRDLACRVYRPATAPAGPLPLVVALHGAGGDESFFFELASNGHIKRLADQHGCIVVTPFTPDLIFSSKPLDSILKGVALDHEIDPDRVFLIGHSMGAMAASRIAADRADSVRHVVCVAGLQPIPKGAAPVLAIQGAIDPIVTPRAVKSAVERSTSEDLTYVELENMGHTLILEEALNRAFATWFEPAAKDER